MAQATAKFANRIADYFCQVADIGTYVLSCHALHTLSFRIHELMTLRRLVCRYLGGADCRFEGGF
jgi:hypothetical protein